MGLGSWLNSESLTVGKVGLAQEQTQINDSSILWSGSISQSSACNCYTELLNKDLPDCTNFMRTSLDLNFDYTKGKVSKGHDAICIHATFRHKGYWGADAVRTEKGSFELGDVYGFAHTHNLAKPPLWLLSAWLDYSFDALSQAKSDGLNRCRIGYFPFQLGRGIALGDSYGVSQDFLGVFIRSNDYFMPGAMVYGKTEDESLAYKVYLARPEAKSTTVAQVLGLTKGHWVGSPDLPFGGSFRDDLIGAVQFDFLMKAEEDDAKKSKRKCVVSPYGFFFYGPDKKVDVDPDSSIELYTFGLAGETEFDNFEFGFDMALNRGSQKMRVVDLNKIIIKKDGNTGALTEYYSHILDSTGKPAVVSDSLIAELNKDLHRDGENFDVAGTIFKSKDGRIRDSYRNNYKGFMSVFDAAYSFKEYGFAVSMITGYASGDTNPHSSKTDKDYNGFIGINEAYSSKRVPSLIVLGGACVKRPMTLDADNNGKLKDFIGGSFTDIMFVGSGFSFTPTCWKASKAKLMTNVLCFWKEHEGFKLNNLGAVSNEKASSFLGTELNFCCSCEPIESLVFSFKTAYFFPGAYYSDVKGASLDNEISKQLAAFDIDQIVNNRDKYSLGNDSCYIFVFETKYSF